MTQRECGPCTLCCQGWLAADINGQKLTPGIGCKDLTDAGCGIYETRPVSPCRKFICAWLQADSPLPEELRPDKAGAIVMLDRKWEGWTTIHATPTGKVIPDETLDILMALARETKTPLIYYENLFDEQSVFLARKKKGYGPPAFLKAVKMSVSDSDINMQDDVNREKS